MSEQSKNKRKSYKQIPEEVREQIIDSILNQGQMIKDVSDRFGAIIKVYQQQGRIGKKKNRNKVHTVIQTFSFFTLNENQIQQLGGIHIEQSKLSLQRKQDFDQHLQTISKVKSQKILDKILQEKKRQEEVAYEANKRFIEYFLNPNNLLQLQSTIPTIPIMNQAQMIKQQLQEFGGQSQYNNSQSQLSSQSQQVKQQ